MKRILLIILLCSNHLLFAQSSDFKKIEQNINQQISQGQWDQVLMLATDLLVEEPGRGEGYYYTAMAFYKQESFDKAKEYLQQSSVLADAALNQKIAALGQEIENASKQKQLLDTADAQIQSGNSIAAAQAYKNVWQSDKTNLNAALDAVEIYLEKEEYEEALSILNDPSLSKDAGAQALIMKIRDTPQMMQINGYNAALDEARGLIQNEKYASAILLYDKAMVFKPNDPAAIQLRKIAEDELAWKNARTKHDIPGYEAYIAGPTLKKHEQEAKNLIRQGLLYHGEQAAKSNDVATMEYYLLQHLNSYGGTSQDDKVKSILCDTYRSNATKLEVEKSAYSQQRAIEFYNSIQKYCPSEDLKTKIQIAEKKRVKYGRPDRGFLSYVYDSIAPIGLSIGSINNQSIGMYLAGSANEEIFTEEALFTVDNQGNFDGSPGSMVSTGEIKTGYADAILGLTKKIAYPLWIYAGAGAAFKNVYQGFEDSSGTEWARNTDESNISVIGDAGIIINYSSLFLRAGVKSDFDEFRFTAGIGFSWK